MKLWILAVGRPAGRLAGAIAEYEARARRYWNLEVVEVRPSKATKGTSAVQVRAEESGRLFTRAPPEAELVALTRRGAAWGSEELAGRLERLAVQGAAGMAFAIGGAFGLDDALLARARYRLALSSFTLPHDVARLVLAEQLYRAGTIVRNQPYHKG